MERLGRKMLIPLLLGFLCFIGVLSISEDTSAAVSKGGIQYPSTVVMEANTSEYIYLYGNGGKPGKINLFNVDKISSNSANLKFPKYLTTGSKYYFSLQEFRVYAKKEGSYTLTITLKIKGKAKAEKIKIAVEVGDRAPVKGITIDGKKMEKEDAGEPVYFSPISSGKMKVTPEKGFEVTKIFVHGDDREQVRDVFGNYPPHYYFGGKKQKVKNGEKVQLNNMANGTTCEIEVREDRKSVNGEDYSPYYFMEETYEFTMAMSKITIYYRVKGSEEELAFDITVYTPVGK